MQDQVFEKIRNQLLNIDPVFFAEKYLTLDGKPFRLSKSGYRPFIEIYRHLGIKALEKDALPIVVSKSRQVGLTTTCSVLEMYFMGCGLFGVGDSPPIRIVHAFPQLDLAYAYSKVKLNGMITASIPIDNPNLSKGQKPKSYMQSMLDPNSPTNDSLEFKQFIGGNHIWVDSVGLDGQRLRGKQLCLETELPTPTGFIKLKDLKEKDQLFDEQGNICNVVKLHPINISPESYRITFDDGATVDACADHLWKTYTKSNRNSIQSKKIKNPSTPSIKTTKEIFETLKTKTKYPENNHSIQTTSPINYVKKHLLIDPYLLGLWLGDGRSNSGEIETADEEVLKDFNFKIKNIYQVSKSRAYRIVGLTTSLYKLDLIKNKHIPNDYLYASYEQRLALLQGLLDSDGFCDKNGRIEFCSVIPQLADNTFQLIKSLGIKCKINKNESWLYDKKCKDRYRINFTTRLPVFKLNRKLQNIKTNKKNVFMSEHRYIINVEKINAKPMRCITVDSTSHLFLITRSFIPTHNTADILFCDEVQLMSSAAIGNSTKMLNKAQYGAKGNGVQVYFGTPLMRGSTFSDMWNRSSQQFYYLGCAKCKEHFPLYTPGTDDWEKTWLYGYTVKCPHCGFEQDKGQAQEDGKWVAHRPEGYDYVGFHINQLYMPEFTKESIIAQKPGNSAVNTERAYQNEVLGEFFSGEAAIITPDQVRELCGDPQRKMRASIAPGEETLVFLGLDIGDKNDLEQLVNSNKSRAQGQSYSTAVVIAMTGPTRISIEFAAKFKKNDLASKKSFIDEVMRKYSCNLGVCDIGHAQDLNEILQTEYGDKFLSSRVMSRVNGKIKFDDQVFPKIIGFEKDFWIAELFDQMKKGNVRFPLGDYEKIVWMIQHCTSMEIKPTVSRTGEISPHYVKGSSPNDAFMALLNAYIAYKYYISNGFKIKNPYEMNDQSGRRPPVVGGYIPKMR